MTDLHGSQPDGGGQSADGRSHGGQQELGPRGFGPIDHSAIAHSAIDQGPIDPGSHVTIDPMPRFGLQIEWPVVAFEGGSAGGLIPGIDLGYQLEADLVRPLLSAFAHGHRVLLHGPAGTGKSTHIEQVAARLRWPCVRINLDGQLTRTEFVGRDQVRLEGGQAVTRFEPGLLVWAIERPVALILDEYDAAPPELLFVIQQLLESGGRLNLLEANRQIEPHRDFRLFATANTQGLGDRSGAYAGTRILNQAHLDRWDVIVASEDLSEARQMELLKERYPQLADGAIECIVQTGAFLQEAWERREISVRVSLRTLLAWGARMAEGASQEEAFLWSIYHRFPAEEQECLGEWYQRLTGVDLPNLSI